MIVAEVSIEMGEDNRDLFLMELVDDVELAMDAVGTHAEDYAKMLCPTKTSNLKNSLTHVAVDDTVYIGTDVYYGIYVEMGTIKMKARPYLKPAVSNHFDEYKKLIEIVLRG